MSHRYSVALKADQFSKAVALAGFKSSYALAKEMHVARSTVMRVRAGHMTPGPAFIGGALTALAPMSFDDLFEVVTI
ncbi:hypothetical protein FHX81_2926 [Saccharothrix saharensis]|uniref:Helix-turn-helix protein n=1 Tax=Saccharothrix saharensis TaxID=571190 RepID=A0A543JCL4_9PSEU|nr:transcriptional regulator [Saccharothrix saharensis]TQM80589.1 hypothetical protein FHX81_2926 [Saccharothrix saharensis]